MGIHFFFLKVSGPMYIPWGCSIEADSFKGKLMQTWKFPYMSVFIWKQYPENFAFLTLGILELCSHEVCKFLKK